MSPGLHWCPCVPPTALAASAWRKHICTWQVYREGLQVAGVDQVSHFSGQGLCRSVLKIDLPGAQGPHTYSVGGGLGLPTRGRLLGWRDLGPSSLTACSQLRTVMSLSCIHYPLCFRVGVHVSHHPSASKSAGQPHSQCKWEEQMSCFIYHPQQPL